MTGVQTCALPICGRQPEQPDGRPARPGADAGLAPAGEAGPPEPRAHSRARRPRQGLGRLRHGKGLGLGRPDYIPFAESDYIFASICEEMGILMGMGVVMLFLILTYRGIKTSMEQHNKFYKYVAFCLSLIFAFQSLIMFGGILKLIPLTGITIPFVSYGGSSILSSFIALGILQYASEENI